MSVPPDRMAVRPAGDPTKIMGVKKPIFWGIIVLGALLAFYIWRRGKSNPSVANTDPEAGLTAADVGGTPGDNSFATTTDQTAIEEQIQQLQNALFQLQQSNGGNGAGISTGGSPDQSGGFITGGADSSGFTDGVIGDQSGGGQLSGDIHWFGPGGSGIWSGTTASPNPVATNTVGPTGIPYSAYTTAGHAL